MAAPRVPSPEPLASAPGERDACRLRRLKAIEAKEKVEIKEEYQTLATITLQNYFRQYTKLAGMTGTAMTEAAEFSKGYNLGVVPIPTNKPMVRVDQRDLIYRTEDAKFDAVVKDIVEKHKTGQPSRPRRPRPSRRPRTSSPRARRWRSSRAATPTARRTARG
jgi:hypothetical protein